MMGIIERLCERSWVAVLCAMVGGAGCSGTEPSASRPSEARSARAVTAATAELEPAIQAMNRFAWSMYGAAAQPSQNLFFSPFGLHTALSMAYAAARSETREEMRTVLAIDGEDAEFHTALGALLGDIAGEHGRGYTLRAANGFFGAEGFDFAPEYVALLGGTYGAAVEAVPFGSDPEAARARVNAFVSDSTRERIEELVPAHFVDELTLAILVNAIHFEAAFATAFDAELTADAPFRLEDGTETLHPHMLRKEKLLSAEDDDFALVELDYADAELALDVIVPLRRGALAEVEPLLTPERVHALLASATVQTLEFTLPRFELTLDLAAATLLEALGMRRAFVAGDADFTGMLANPDSLDPHVTAVLHRAFVRVDERGTEAAAASAVVVGTRSAPLRVAADHPFVFLIRDKLTGVTLFVGRVSDPRGHVATQSR